MNPKSPSFRGKGLTMRVIPPAFQCSIGVHTAAVHVTGADGAESFNRRAGLTVVIQSKALHLMVIVDKAGVATAGGDISEETGRGQRLLIGL